MGVESSSTKPQTVADQGFPVEAENQYDCLSLFQYSWERPWNETLPSSSGIALPDETVLIGESGGGGGCATDAFPHPLGQISFIFRQVSGNFRQSQRLVPELSSVGTHLFWEILDSPPFLIWVFHDRHFCQMIWLSDRNAYRETLKCSF